jgi:Glycosyltransferase family 87
MLRYLTIRDGRSILILALIFYFVVLLLVCSQAGSRLAWGRLGVHHLSPAFADMRFIMSAIESERAGYDPYQRNPRDPWKRRMNYPRVWLLPSVVGLQLRHTVPLAVGLAAIFFLSLLVLVGPLTLEEGGVYALLVCSPPVIQGVERGNVDLLIFSLLTLAVWLTRRRGTRSIWPYGIIIACSLLKLYPILATAVALRDRSRTVAFSIIGTAWAIFLSYLFWIRSDLTAIVRNTWTASNISFGSKVVFLQLDWWMGPINTTAWSLASLALAAAVATIIVKRTSTPVFSMQTVDSMLIGMSIYTGIFALLGSNYNYKLSFLIFAVPQMLQWIRHPNAYQTFAGVFLTTMALAFWMSPSPPQKYWGFLLKEVMNWCLFEMSIVVLLHFLFASPAKAIGGALSFDWRDHVL